MLELVAITLDGARTAERRLGELRDGRDDQWLSEVSIIEHDTDGRYSVKAKNPHLEAQKAGRGAAIGGLTGLFVGAIGGPFGLVLWTMAGTAVGASVGASRESVFLPEVEELKSRLAPGASMLILIGETDTVHGLERAVGALDHDVLRKPLSSQQARELTEAASVSVPQRSDPAPALLPAQWPL